MSSLPYHTTVKKTPNGFLTSKPTPIQGPARVPEHDPSPGPVLRLVRRWLARYGMIVVAREELIRVGDALDHVATSQAIRGPFHGTSQTKLNGSRARVARWCAQGLNGPGHMLEQAR